jgi:signal transduction histidine kinase
LPAPALQERDRDPEMSRNRPWRWQRLLGPEALAGRPQGWAFAAVCVLALALVFIAETVTPSAAILGAFSVLPVLAAAWLLSRFQALGVAALAILFRIATVPVDRVHPLTVAAEVVTIIAIAAVGRVAAVSLTAFRAAETLAEERERMSRELHDGTIQSLFAVGIELKAAQAQSGDGRMKAAVDNAVDELDRVILDLRQYIFGLRSAILSDQQLDQALGQLVQDLGAKRHLRVEANIDRGVAAALAAQGNDVVQMTREALSNVSRHASARSCRVSLRRVDGTAELEVVDDGRGFDLATQDGKGHGLPNIRKRAAALAGDAQVQTSPGMGTTIRIRIPLSRGPSR